MGSLVVTTIAVSRGQSLATAAVLTISSTVMALVRLPTEILFARAYIQLKLSYAGSVDMIQSGDSGLCYVLRRVI